MENEQAERLLETATRWRLALERLEKAARPIFDVDEQLYDDETWNELEEALNQAQASLK